MRRLAACTLALGIVAVAPLPLAGQAGGGLSLEASGVYVLRPLAQEGDQAQKVFVLHQGQRYRFQVDYTVRGARRISTGHTFVFEQAVSGRRVDQTTKTFPPEGPGRYNESSTRQIPVAWTPGVYRMRWTVTARHPRLSPVEVTGTRVFLVVGP